LHDEKLLDRLFKGCPAGRADAEKWPVAGNWVEIILGKISLDVAAKFTDSIYREPSR